MKRVRSKGYVVAIDGPAGAGKSTVSRKLAAALQGRLLDTGGMYRSVAYFALKTGASTEMELGKIARSLRFDVEKKHQHLLVNGIVLGLKLRTQKVGQMASHISKFGAVRRTLTQKQRTLGRAWSKKEPVVVEGRDIGSVVFPKLEFKFFVTADPTVRAKRRYQELRSHGGKGMSLKKVLRLQKARDRQDSSRRLAPLTCPSDAIVVDTSRMSIDQVVEFMKTHIQRHSELL